MEIRKSRRTDRGQNWFRSSIIWEEKLLMVPVFQVGISLLRMNLKEFIIPREGNFAKIRS